MKKILVVLVTFFLLVSCKFNETPEFVSVSAIEITDYTSEKITLNSDLVFNNPNHLGGVLQANDIKVFVNNIDMGNINSEDFKIPPQTTFTVPIEFEFSYKDIFKDPENLLQNVLNAVTEKKIEVKYIGKLTYKLNVFSYDYPLDYSQEISLKK